MTSANTSLMKRMKKRLKESADHYRVLVTQASSGQGQVPVLSAATRELYENLIRLVEVMTICCRSSVAMERDLAEIINFIVRGNRNVVHIAFEAHKVSQINIGLYYIGLQVH